MKGRDEEGRFLPGHRVHKFKTIVKERKIAEARRKGELKAELEMHQRKPLEESTREHIGKLIDNLKLDPVDVLIYLGLGALSYDAFGKTPAAALVGPIGYKLATTMGGTPPVSQVAGLAILGSLGLLTAAPGLADLVPVIPVVNQGTMQENIRYDGWWINVKGEQDFQIVEVSYILELQRNGYSFVPSKVKGNYWITNSYEVKDIPTYHADKVQKAPIITTPDATGSSVG